MSGWIKLHREIKDKAIFDNEKLLKTFIWCLLKATHAEHEQLIGRQKVPLKPGQFVTGRNKAGAELNMPPSTAWEYLKILESNKSINIKSNNKFSVVSVENWGLYQSEDEKSDNKPNNKSTTNRQQIDTNKNVKNDKNDKKNKYAEFVSMTEDEYNKLLEKHGELLTRRMIEILDNYKGSKGKKYKSDYRAILSWVEGKVLKESVKGGKNSGSNNNSDRGNEKEGEIDSAERAGVISL